MIYYHFNDDLPLFALVIYGKGDRANLTPDEKKAVTAFATKAKALAKNGD